MTMTPKIREILGWYESDNPGSKASLARILNAGHLGGTGKLVILPVDQGFEHAQRRGASPPTPQPMTRAIISSSPSMPG
jgi:class I fructose-bisphosphate aldolase